MVAADAKQAQVEVDLVADMCLMRHSPAGGRTSKQRAHRHDFRGSNSRNQDLTHVRKRDEDNSGSFDLVMREQLWSQEASDGRRKDLHTNSSLLAESQTHLYSNPTSIERSPQPHDKKRGATVTGNSSRFGKIMFNSGVPTERGDTLRDYMDSRFMRVPANDFSRIIETSHRESVLRNTSSRCSSGDDEEQGTGTNALESSQATHRLNKIVTTPINCKRFFNKRPTGAIIIPSSCKPMTPFSMTTKAAAVPTKFSFQLDLTKPETAIASKNRSYVQPIPPNFKVSRRSRLLPL